MRYLQQLQVGNSQNWLVTRMTGFRQKFFCINNIISVRGFVIIIRS